MPKTVPHYQLPVLVYQQNRLITRVVCTQAAPHVVARSIVGRWLVLALWLGEDKLIYLFPRKDSPTMDNVEAYA